MRRAHPPQPTSPGAAPAVAMGGLVAVLVLTGLNLWLLVLNWTTDAPVGLASSPVEIVTAMTYATLAGIGLAVIVRRRDNLVGWVFLIAGLGLAFAAFASEYATYGVLTEPGSLPLVRYVTWAGAWMWWAAACFGLSFGLLLYPDGALPSPRWRVVAWAAVVNLVLLTCIHALTPGPLDGEYAMVVNPFGVGDADTERRIRDLAWLLVTVNALIAAAALFTRARRATAERRRQLLWLAIPVLAAVVAAPLWGLTGDSDEGPSVLATVLVLLVIFGVPVAVASALARGVRLRRSVERLVLAREEERTRIRRDLHDGLGPTLAGVALQLDVTRGMVRQDPDAAEDVLAGVVDRVKDAIGDIRRLVDDLRPPVLDQLGLVSAIREGTSYLKQRGHDGDLAVTIETTGNVTALPPATEVTAFRIVMEAVTNASRHGQASHCIVRLDVDGALELRVEDDGCGVDPNRVLGVGLRSMQERAAELGGTCAVEPRPGGGTIVRAHLPIGGPS